jgi:hypothetical protein
MAPEATYSLMLLRITFIIQSQSTSRSQSSLSQPPCTVLDAQHVAK